MAQRLTVTRLRFQSPANSGLDMFSIIIRGSIEDEDIQISSDIYETFQANISSVLDGEQRKVSLWKYFQVFCDDEDE